MLQILVKFHQKISIIEEWITLLEILSFLSDLTRAYEAPPKNVCKVNVQGTLMFSEYV